MIIIHIFIWRVPIILKSTTILAELKSFFIQNILNKFKIP